MAGQMSLLGTVSVYEMALCRVDRHAECAGERVRSETWTCRCNCSCHNLTAEIVLSPSDVSVPQGVRKQ